MNVNIRLGSIRREVEELKEKTWELDTNTRNNLGKKYILKGTVSVIANYSSWKAGSARFTLVTLQPLMWKLFTFSRFNSV